MCFLFVDEQEAGPSEAKITRTRQINPMAQVNKVLKFRLYLEQDRGDGGDADKQADNVGCK